MSRDAGRACDYLYENCADHLGASKEIYISNNYHKSNQDNDVYDYDDEMLTKVLTIVGAVIGVICFFSFRWRWLSIAGIVISWVAYKREDSWLTDKVYKLNAIDLFFFLGYVVMRFFGLM